MSTNGTSNGTTVSPASQVEELGMEAYRVPSLLQPHRVREALADAHAGRIRPLIGMLGLASPPVAKLSAQLGFDVLWVDWEHAAMTVETMTQGRTMAFVRVPGHGPESIGYAIDAGASIVVPPVDTVDQARHIVSAAKYGAKGNGTRSAPPVHLLPGISDTRIQPKLSVHQNLNNQATIIIQIETIIGIQNLDVILTAIGEHIDSVWLGSLDARISMSLEGFWGDEKEWGRASGLALGDPETEARLARGRSLIFTSVDVFALMACAGELAEARKLFPKQSFEGVYSVLNRS